MTVPAFDTVRQRLESVARSIAAGQVGSASRHWGGADVVISDVEPQPDEDAFYPEPRYVVTPNASQLSWLFEELRDAFVDLLDGANKIEFYGRLANAAMRYQWRTDGREQAHDLLSAVLHEAFAMLDEFEEGSFEYFWVALGNEIVDDYVDDAIRTGFVGTEATREFFSRKGVEL